MSFESEAKQSILLLKEQEIVWNENAREFRRQLSSRWLRHRRRIQLEAHLERAEFFLSQLSAYRLTLESLLLKHEGLIYGA
jgi:hypothetical protein